jgi:uncharacterized cupredoxin-like copper-binding protein
MKHSGRTSPAALLIGAVALAAVLSACSLAPGYWMHGPVQYGAATPVTDQPSRASGGAVGTATSPRIVRIVAGPGDTFSPDRVAVSRGETVTFVVTTMGPLVHEFKVGPLDEVKADAEGLPEITDLTMMTSQTLTYTFDGPGPYGFACHEPGHFEAGMWGTITVSS